MSRPTDLQLENAVGYLSAMKFFPAYGDTGARGAIKAVLQAMVAEQKQLEWLVQTMVMKVPQWNGPLDMRGIFCTRFKPADGIEACTSTAGFSAEDMEAQDSYEYKALNGSLDRSGSTLGAGEILKRLGSGL